MAKQAVPVPGHEGIVEQLKAKSDFFKHLKEEVDSLKAKLREVARGFGGEAKSFQFLGDKGMNSVTVSLADPSLAGNRTLIRGPLIDKLAAEGFDIESDKAIIATTRSYTLSGQWVGWIEAFLKQQGVNLEELPEGMVRKEETRLTAEGVEALADKPELLASCTKDAKVVVS